MKPKYTGIVDLGFGWTIETWYDRKTRLYITQFKHEGDQVGDAIYGSNTGVRGAVDTMRYRHRDLTQK